MTPRGDPNPPFRIDHDSVGMDYIEVQAIHPNSDDVSERVCKNNGSAVQQCIDTVRRTHAGEYGGEPKIGVNRVQLRASQTCAVDGPRVKQPITPGYRVIEGQIIPSWDCDNVVKRAGIRFNFAQRSAGNGEHTAISRCYGSDPLRKIDRSYVAIGNRVQTLAWDVEKQQAAIVPDQTFAQFALEALDGSP